MLSKITDDFPFDRSLPFNAKMQIIDTKTPFLCFVRVASCYNTSLSVPLEMCLISTGF